MKRILLSLVILVLVLSIPLLISSYMDIETNSKSAEVLQEEKQHADESEEKAISDLVKGFGNQLQFVSLLAPKDILEKNMQEYYGDYVSPELIEKWIKDPLNAPGRLTSSPWPDRIEILSIVKLTEAEYEVKGEIVEITSTEQESEEFANKRPITLIVKKRNNQWLIDHVILGDYEKTNLTIYRNVEYGFEFSLPKSWGNYQIVNGEWEGRNSKYVFALPARYNFAFPKGYEEVEDILEGTPLVPIEE